MYVVHNEDHIHHLLNESIKWKVSYIWDRMEYFYFFIKNWTTFIFIYYLNNILKINYVNNTHYKKSNDIWTTILVELLGQPCCSLFSLVKNNGERKRKRENKKIMWVWERKLYKNGCTNIISYKNTKFIWKRKKSMLSHSFTLYARVFHRLSIYRSIIITDQFDKSDSHVTSINIGFRCASSAVSNENEDDWYDMYVGREMIFEYSFCDNFCDNFLSHTHITFLNLSITLIFV